MAKRHREHIYISDIQKRMFFCAFITAVAAGFARSMTSLIDNFIIVSFFGEIETAAVAVANPFFNIVEIPAVGISLGVQTVCARELGAGKIDIVNRLFNQILTLFAVIMAIMTVLAFVFAKQIAIFSGAGGNTAELLPYATAYLRGLSFEVFPYVIFFIISPIVVMDNGSKMITIASVCGFVTNVVVDLLSVALGWGLFGIGIGTAATSWMYFIIAAAHFANKSKIIRFRPAMPRMKELKQIFISGLPSAMTATSHTIQAELLILIISRTGGVVGMAVLTVFKTFHYIVGTASGGLTGAVSIMAGIMCGEKNGEELETVQKQGDHYGNIVAICVIAVLAIIAVPVSYALFQTTGRMLMIFALGCLAVETPLSNKLHIRISYLHAIGHLREAQILRMLNNMVFLVASAWVLSIPFGIYGVYMAYAASPLLTLFTSWVYHVKLTGKVHLTEADYLGLDDSYFAGPGDVISYPVDSIEDCTLASEQVVLFCRGHKLDEKKAMLAGLCTEELTTNVIKHGASQRHIPGASDLRVVIDGSDVIIRLRDDGRPFNLMELADRINQDWREETESRSGKGTGVKILLGTASNVSYYRTYGMNTTIIRI